ncbi:MAG: hypothetical protein IJU50_04545 [Lachnospiraceae bacterium]|nr:hypothetical protein [Lachnospiraceae bacterium]
MADIYRYEKPAKSRMGEFARTIFIHRVRLVYRALLLVAIIAASGFLAYRLYEAKEYTGYEVSSFNARESIPGQVCRQLGSGILVYSKDGAHGIDAKGQKLWDVTFELQNPRVCISGPCAALYDENGRSVYLVGEKESFGEIKTTLPIKNAAISEGGVVALLEADGEVTWIYLYDSSGEELVAFKTSMSGSGYPVAIALSPNATLFGASFLYADRGEFKTSVSFYNFGSVGHNYTDRYVSGYDYVERVVPMVGFLNADTMYALADDRIMFYSGTEIPVSKADVFLTERVLSVFAQNGYVSLVFTDTTGESRYRLETYDATGSLCSSVLLDIDYTDIVVGEGSIMAYNSTECQIFSISGLPKLNTTFNSPVLLAIPKSHFRFVLVTSRGIETIKLD